MSNTAAARNTILQSIYCLRRRRSVIPLADVTNTLRRATAPAPPSSQQTKSLVQGGHTNRNARPSPSCIIGGGGTRTNTRNGRTGTTNTLTRPSLLRGPQSHANNGVREHYAATATAVHSDVNGATTNATSLNDLITPSTQTQNKKSDLIVVLDLDECLIHSQFLNTNESYRQYEERPASHAFQNDDEPSSIVPSACESFRMPLPDGDLVHVNKRPNLDAFLKELTGRFETHVFTAAMEVYASPLLDRLDPEGGMFEQRYYRDACTFDPSLGVYVKDLKHALANQSLDDENALHGNDNIIGSDGGSPSSYNAARVVLIDNNPMSFLANPTNGILVSNFYDDPKDDTLLAVLDLLDDLDGEEDVRPVLDQKFGLKDALREAVQGAGTHASWR